MITSKRFLPLFISQFLGAFNDNACKNALLVWLVFNASHTENIINIAAALFILPYVIFSVTAGEVADKFDKAKIAQLIKFIEMPIVSVFIISFLYQSKVGLLFGLFLMGLHSTFFGTIKYSLLPENLEENELIKGNGLIEASTFIGILLGTIFGGVIITLQNGIMIFGYSTLTIALCGWIASLFIPNSTKCDSSIKIKFNLIKSSKNIIKTTRENKQVWNSIIALSWFWLMGATYMTQFPLYTKTVIHGNANIVTFFLALFSVGIGAGAIFCNSVTKGEISSKIIPSSTLGMSICIFCFYAASTFYHYPIQEQSVISLIQGGLVNWIIIISLFSLAVFAGIYTVPLYAMIQHSSCIHNMSRTIAVNNIINALFMIFASFWAILLFGLHMHVTSILLTVGIVNLLFFKFNKTAL